MLRRALVINTRPEAAAGANASVSHSMFVAVAAASSVNGVPANCALEDWRHKQRLAPEIPFDSMISDALVISRRSYHAYAACSRSNNLAQPRLYEFRPYANHVQNCAKRP